MTTIKDVKEALIETDTGTSHYYNHHLLQTVAWYLIGRDKPKEDELLPCPFCGGSAVVSSLYGDWYVECDLCDAGGSGEDTKAEAIAAWNTRAGDAGNNI